MVRTQPPVPIYYYGARNPQFPYTTMVHPNPSSHRLLWRTQISVPIYYYGAPKSQFPYTTMVHPNPSSHRLLWCTQISVTILLIWRTQISVPIDYNSKHKSQFPYDIVLLCCYKNSLSIYCYAPLSPYIMVCQNSTCHILL